MSSQNYYPQPPPPPDWQPTPPPPRRKSGAWKTIVALIIVLMLLFVLFYTPIGMYLFSGLIKNSYASNSSFTLTRTITITTNREVSYLCDIPVPGSFSLDGTSAQIVTDTSHTPAAASVSRYGGTWLEWEGTESGTIIMSLSTEAKVNTLVWDIDEKNSGMASAINIGIWSSQLDNEWEIAEDGNPTGEYNIWPTHPTIVSLVGQLTSDDLSVYENMASIYDYLDKNLEYETISGLEVKPCLATLQDRAGDCDDQSMLLISLLRSAGIPSWLAFGTLYDGTTGQWGAHAWVEAYVPLAEGGSETVVIDIVNDEFLVRNCNRLEEWKSDGNGEHLADYYHLLSYNYTMTPHQQAPVVTISDEYSGGYEASSERVYAFVLDITLLERTDVAIITPLSFQRKVF